MIQRRKDLLIAEGKFACLTKHTKHTHYFGTKALHFSSLSFPSRMNLHAFREGLLNLGLSLHHSTGSISSDNKPTIPTMHIHPYWALQ